jgi:hypothetical protein
MDQTLMWIGIGMAAILFFWIGYLLGNMFPVAKRDGTRAMPKIETEKITGFFKGLWDKLFADDDEEETEADTSDPEALGYDPSQVASPLPKLKETTHLWHDSLSKKLFAEVEGVVVNLDEKLTSEQHSRLSFLLVDLQDKVGVSASLREIIAEREGEAFPEKEKIENPTFNPVKSFINYVQSDVPKLEDKADTIPEQINAILKEMVEDTDLKERGISVREWPNRGLVFIVGVDIYDDIHQIPDPEVRMVIRKAVKAWEERGAE